MCAVRRWPVLRLLYLVTVVVLFKLDRFWAAIRRAFIALDSAGQGHILGSGNVCFEFPDGSYSFC
jgi:hypothetical protein